MRRRAAESRFPGIGGARKVTSSDSSSNLANADLVRDLERDGRVLVLLTGGTMAMKPNARGSLEPRRGYLAEQMRLMPELRERRMPAYEVVEYTPLLDSADMVPADWCRIATDVAARGIDVAGLPFVIQRTLSDDIENYIHRIGRCGRADRLGLAISLVATQREKVWYHKCPSRGKNCLPKPGNTKLTIPFEKDGKLAAADASKWWVDEGGCTIWYDELDILSKVETRIGMSMLVMDPADLSVEGVLDSPLPGGKKKTAQADENMEPLSRRAQKRKRDEPKAVVYGMKKTDSSAATSSKHLSSIAPAVRELGALERKIQQIFAKAMYGESGDEVGAPKVDSSVMRVSLACAAMVMGHFTPNLLRSLKFSQHYIRAHGNKWASDTSEID